MLQFPLSPLRAVWGGPGLSSWAPSRAAQAFLCPPPQTLVSPTMASGQPCPGVCPGVAGVAVANEPLGEEEEEEREGEEEWEGEEDAGGGGGVWGVQGPPS